MFVVTAPIFTGDDEESVPLTEEELVTISRADWDQCLQLLVRNSRRLMSMAPEQRQDYKAAYQKAPCLTTTGSSAFAGAGCGAVVTCGVGLIGWAISLSGQPSTAPPNPAETPACVPAAVNHMDVRCYDFLAAHQRLVMKTELAQMKKRTSSSCIPGCRW